MEQLLKPAVALYRAGTYFIIGIVLVVISTIWHPPFESIQAPDRVWYHDLIDKGVGSLGNIAWFMFLAGLAYAVLIGLGDYLWSSKLQVSVENGFKGMADALVIGSGRISYGSVAKWIDNSSEPGEKYRSVALSSMCRCYGPHSRDERSYLNYVVNNLIDTHATESSITRYNFHNDITVKKSDDYNDLLRWEEKKGYTIKCHSGSATSAVKAATSTRANADNVQQLLKLLDLTVSIDEVKCFSFQEWLKDTGQLGPGTFKKKRGDCEIEFDGTWVSVVYMRQLEISKPETRVGILEFSFISKDERCYSLIIGEPTYDVSLTMRLYGLPKWQLQKPVIGATWYHSGSTNFATIDQNDAQWVSAHIPRWVLPGIWATIEWASE